MDTEGTQYTLVFFDAAYGILHAAYLNIPGSNVPEGDVSIHPSSIHPSIHLSIYYSYINLSNYLTDRENLLRTGKSQCDPTSLSIYLSSVNHKPSILTMRCNGQKRKIIRKMCISQQNNHSVQDKNSLVLH